MTLENFSDQQLRAELERRRAMGLKREFEIRKGMVDLVNNHPALFRKLALASGDAETVRVLDKGILCDWALVEFRVRDDDDFSDKIFDNNQNYVWEQYEKPL